MNGSSSSSFAVGLDFGSLVRHLFTKLTKAGDHSEGMVSPSGGRDVMASMARVGAISE